MDCYGAPEKWYHINQLLIDGDSIFLYKSPAVINGKDTSWSASDGGFPYYYGTLLRKDSLGRAYLTRYNCDYCAVRFFPDTSTGWQFPVPVLDTLAFRSIGNKVQLGDVTYDKKMDGFDSSFPPRSLFYLDSNSIYRNEPRGQYRLISQGILDLLRTRKLKLDGDTLHVCSDRVSTFSGPILETLDPSKLQIDTMGMVIRYHSYNELNQWPAQGNKPLRVIEINEIVEYWKAARIGITYRIWLPKTVHRYQDREYSGSLEYNKTPSGFTLLAPLDPDWTLKEQK